MSEKTDEANNQFCLMGSISHGEVSLWLGCDSTAVEPLQHAEETINTVRTNRSILTGIQSDFCDNRKYRKPPGNAGKTVIKEAVKYHFRKSAGVRMNSPRRLLLGI